MSFFDDASLAFLPSGAAGKDGKAYSIKPVPVFGSEAVTNGDFASDSDWNKGNRWSIGSGVATKESGATSNLSQVIDGISGKTLRVSYEVSNYSGGNVGASPDGSNYNPNTGNGIFIEYITPASNNLYIRGNYSFGGSIDNVSVKEVSNDGDFTFSRGSNLAATRVGADGLIEKGRENLLKNSNNFNTTGTAWNPTSAYTLTSGQSGYDGSNDAWLLNKTTTANDYFQQRSIVGMSGNVIAISIYAKDNNIGGLTIFNANGFAQFKLTGSGSVISHTGIDAKIEPVSGASGWFRCSLSVGGGSAYDRLMFKPTAENATDTSGSIFIQSAQLEIGLAATDYIESGATTGKAGLLEDEPRFDYSGGATCPSLLLEGSRTNLATHSEYIQGLSLTGLTPTPNATTSPEGLQNAYKVLTGTANNDQIFVRATGTSGNAKTQSVYIKADSGVQWIRLIQIRSGFSNSASTWFDIQNGVKGSKTEAGTTSVVDNSTKIEDAGNGWYRLTLVCTDSTNNTIFDTRIRTAAGNSSTSRVSNGSYFVWGHQMESNASYPTSYIPNHSGGSVTRGGDNCSTSNNSLLEQTSATYFLELTPIEILSNNLIEVRGDGSTSNRVIFQTNAGGAIRVLVRAQGSSILDQNVGSVVSQNTKVKVALKYTPSNISFFVDGVKKIDTDVSVDFNPELNGLDLEGSATANDDALKQHQFLFFPEALSDADCITLTT